MLPQAAHPSSQVCSFDHAVCLCPQILTEHLVCVFCSRDAAKIKTHENHCLLVLSLHIGGDGWRGSLAHIVGACRPLLKGEGDKELVEGHMVSSGQNWDKESHTPASGSWSLSKALMGPRCPPRPWLECSLSRSYEFRG